MATTKPTIPLGTGIKNLRIVVQTNALFEQTKLIPIAGNSSITLRYIYQFFQDLVNGVWNSNINVMASGVYATGTAVCASVIATDTLVIGGVTLTADNSTQGNATFVRSTNNTTTATNLTTCINANTSLDQLVQASSSGATVTIVCLVPGTIGNLVTLSAGGGTITVGSALTGGTDGASGTVSHGL